MVKNETSLEEQIGTYVLRQHSDFYDVSNQSNSSHCWSHSSMDKNLILEIKFRVVNLNLLREVIEIMMHNACGDQSEPGNSLKRNTFSNSSFFYASKPETMLIEWVKDSILQCLCRSCKSHEILEKSILHEVHCTQPTKKGAYIATEIRAAEKSKGGMAYEVILAQPAAETPPKLPDSPPKTSLSVEDIENKLKAAKERRQSMEQQKLNQLAEKMNRIDEVSQKKAEFNNNFINQTKEQLELKMVSIKENRESYLSELRAKLKDHNSHIEEVQMSIKSHKEQLKENIVKKLNNASENRDENLQKMITKLKEHFSKAKVIILDRKNSTL
uniref:Stathmin-4 n=1 Tax=Strigamia maritima TaxID=126957 RepID=T1JD68_STRMM